MNRLALEHVIRAASAISRDPNLIVFGSQAILGSYPNAPEELLISVEVDIYPKTKPEAVDLIDGSIGEESIFHQTFGYYAHGVSPEVATLPDDWQTRLVPVHNENTGGGTGWCLEIHDLTISKLAAGREKDLDYLSVLIRHKLIDLETLQTRLERTPVAENQKQFLRERLRRLIRENAK